MKSIVYKMRIIVSIILFLLTMLLLTNLYSNKILYPIFFIIAIFASLNRKILGNRVNWTNKEEIFLLVSYIVIYIVFIFLIYNITINKIINN